MSTARRKQYRLWGTMAEAKKKKETKKEKHIPDRELSCRDFLKNVLAGAMGIGAAARSCHEQVFWSDCGKDL